ncbi:MAG: hypothetical protein A2Y40_04240 [Candidatus Margulisbacteria bacterium GWF2_35_9]|nr:MAG: hypothetical protein A2Y40_04240 [Candidatus Margulisbacteria bacterium GWF2_35_9]
MIVNICKGGLGNRLKPLASCYALSKKTNRKLAIVWEPDMRCGAVFSHLFSNKIDVITLDQILSKKRISFYTHMDWIRTYSPELLPIAKKSKIKPLETTVEIQSDKNELIVIYSNDYLAGPTADECKVFFDWLIPIKIIEEKRLFVETSLKLDKSFIGVHARGTDFEAGGITVQTYIYKMNEEYKKNNTVKFFVCSDSLEYEMAIKNAFPLVYFNKKDNYVFKDNALTGWSNNVQTPSESVQDALVDMILLSKTNFKIYHPNSTFAHIVNMLSSGMMETNPTEAIKQKKASLYSIIKKFFNLLIYR